MHQVRDQQPKEEEMRSSSKKRSSSIATAGAILLMAALAVFSQGQDGPRHRFPGGAGGPGGARRDGIGLLLRDLNLTDDQKAQIKKITDSFEESTKSLRDQLKTLHESEPDPFSGTFDEAAVRAIAEARAKVDIELSVARAKLMSQIAAVLTTEQKAQLASRRTEFAQRPPEPQQ
jgi:Spy/CpxP family protein refolding chaperone